MSTHVVITGCSSGIGESTALLLASKGFTVHAGVRKQTDADKLKHSNVQPFILDVASSESIVKAKQHLTTVLDAATQVHLINNAGIAVSGPIEALQIKQLRHQFDVNFFGLLEWTQALLPWIRKTKGRIINLSSVSGLVVSPYLGAYSASKFALEAASDALRRELLPFGVKVILLEPGPIATPIWDKNLDNKELILQNLNQSTMPLYKESLDRFEDKIIKSSKKFALPVEKVAESAYQALTKPNPPLRILIASQPVMLQTRLAQYLPGKVIDKILGKVFYK